MVFLLLSGKDAMETVFVVKYSSHGTHNMSKKDIQKNKEVKKCVEHWPGNSKELFQSLI